MTEKYAIVGLGNPGSRYDMTRHNIGFMCVDAFSKTYGLTWKNDSKNECELADGVVCSHKVFFVKPQTYMNLSGRSVTKLSKYHDIPLENILIILDDTALPFGKLRFRKSGSAGGHNGLDSLIADFGTQDILRLRIGVDKPPSEWELSNYVLAKFTNSEQNKLDKIIDACTQGLEMFLKEGVDASSNYWNSWKLESNA